MGGRSADRRDRSEQRGEGVSVNISAGVVATGQSTAGQGQGGGAVGAEGSGGGCWWGPLACAMGCFGSQGSKGQASDDAKSQKRKSDAITRQLQKDKQVSKHTYININDNIE